MYIAHAHMYTSAKSYLYSSRYYAIVMQYEVRD